MDHQDRDPAAPSHSLAARGEEAPPREPSGGAAFESLVVLPTGALSLDQLAAVFASLPVSVTVVGRDDRVRFVSEGQPRVFARPTAILGEPVQRCHAPSSLELVKRILSDFRSGRHGVAESWMNFKGRFVHVRYLALRDTRSAYLGTLEVVQDLTRERALQGERRALQYRS